LYLKGIFKERILFDMDVAVLYSGGKDSSLAAHLLDKMGFTVTLVTATFGISADHFFAQESAKALGFEFNSLRLEKDILQEARSIVERDGYPRYAITYIHKKALETASKSFRALSDGTRRDDKSPFLNLKDFRCLEDGFDVEYIPVLRGFGHKTINNMCSRLFAIEEGESSKINKGDYEGELRTYLERKGLNIEKIFPPHQQTRVTSWRKEHVKSDEGKED
jgi:predicted subunit of tRNA(5-methylaminomethyl-2-thiouridylate) methyltransferase